MPSVTRGGTEPGRLFGPGAGSTWDVDRDTERHFKDGGEARGPGQRLLALRQVYNPNPKIHTACLIWTPSATTGL